MEFKVSIGFEANPAFWGSRFGSTFDKSYGS